MKTFKEHVSDVRYVEYHLHNGKKVIIKSPKDKGDFITGAQVISRTNAGTVHGTNNVAITKHHVIGKSAIKSQKDLHHDLTYDELVEK